jgi:prevent-host-death family protein
MVDIYLEYFEGPNGTPMRISVTEAKGQLTDLVRRAEAGDEIILTRHGRSAVLWDVCT